MSCVPLPALGSTYKHKSEAEIAQLTPASGAWDEFAKEQAYHRFDLQDQQGLLLEKWVMSDGLAAVPRITQLIDEYNATPFLEWVQFSKTNGSMLLKCC